MKLFLVTNKDLAQLPYLDIIEEVCRAGIDGIILREDLNNHELKELALDVKSITNSYGTTLIINGNRQVYTEIGADYFHSKERQFLKSGIVETKQGVSVHSLDNAIKAKSSGAQYILAGHIFPTDSKAGLKAKGIEYLKNIIDTGIPTVAIGGIDRDTLPLLKDIDLLGVAVMSTIMSSPDPYRIVRNLKSIIDLPQEDRCLKI